MKLNWGYKIVAFYVVFVIGIMVLVFSSASQKVDLVSTDYYEQEIKYQQRINAKSNSSELSSPLIVSNTGENVHIVMPVEMNGILVQANILMYCPFDNTKDYALQLSANDAALDFKMPAGTKGSFVAKINWNVAGKQYYGEHKILF